MTQKEKFMLLKQIIKERAELQRVLKANRKTVNFKGERTEIEFDMNYKDGNGKTFFKKIKLGSMYASKYVNPFGYYCNYERIDGKSWHLCESRIPGFDTMQFSSTTSLIDALNFLYRVLKNERKTVKKSQELVEYWEKNCERYPYIKKAYDWVKEYEEDEQKA